MASREPIQFRVYFRNYLRCYAPLFQLCVCGSMYMKHVRRKCLYGPGKFKPEPITYIDFRYETHWSNVYDQNINDTIIRAHKYYNNKKRCVDEVSLNESQRDFDHFIAVGFKAFFPQRFIRKCCLRDGRNSPLREALELYTYG